MMPHVLAVGRRTGVYWRRPIIATIVLAALFTGEKLFVAWHAETCSSAAVKEALRNLDKIAIRVELGFPPEKFHLLFLQKRGRVTGVSGSTVHMADVSADNVRTIAGRYWVSRVDVREEG